MHSRLENDRRTKEEICFFFWQRTLGKKDYYKEQYEDVIMNGSFLYTSFGDS